MRKLKPRDITLLVNGKAKSRTYVYQTKNNNNSIAFSLIPSLLQ